MGLHEQGLPEHSPTQGHARPLPGKGKDSWAPGRTLAESTCPGNRVGGLPVPHIHQEGGGTPSTNRGVIGNRIYELQELMQG